MKKFVLPAAIIGILLASAASAATCTTAICKTDGTLAVNSGGTFSLSSGSTTTHAGTETFSGTVDASGMTFSTSETGNPLVQYTVQNIPIASINATGGYNFISGVTGKRVYPAGLTLMATGGACATSSGVKVLCTSGNVLASVAVAVLTSANPIVYGSTNVNAGTAYSQGCASGDSVYVSNIGSSLATCTGIYLSLPYTIQ